MTEPARIARTLTSVPNFYLVLFAFWFSSKSLGLGLEGDAHRVDAVAIAGRGLRGVIENVSQVTATFCASNFGAHHAVGSILDVFNGFVVLRFIKTWPTAVRVKLGIGDEQECVAASAVIAAFALFLKQFTGVGTLGAAHAQYVVLELTEFLFPLFVGFIDFVLQFWAPTWLL